MVIGANASDLRPTDLPTCRAALGRRSARQEQLRNVWAADAARFEKTEREIADYERKLAEAGRACLLDRDDLQFLRQ